MPAAILLSPVTASKTSSCCTGSKRTFIAFRKRSVPLFAGWRASQHSPSSVDIVRKRHHAGTRAMPNNFFRSRTLSLFASTPTSLHTEKEQRYSSRPRLEPSIPRSEPPIGHKKPSPSLVAFMNPQSTKEGQGRTDGRRSMPRGQGGFTVERRYSLAICAGRESR